MSRRVLLALLSGAVLGVFCILGASIRIGWEGNQLLILSLWYNRLIMGLVIGLAGDLKIIQGELNWLLRGGLLGLVVSAAYFLTSGAADLVSFLAGVVYGMIIEFVLSRQRG